jgi:hypothetical protein
LQGVGRDLVGLIDLDKGLVTLKMADRLGGRLKLREGH